MKRMFVATASIVATAVLALSAQVRSTTAEMVAKVGPFDAGTGLVVTKGPFDAGTGLVVTKGPFDAGTGLVVTKVGPFDAGGLPARA